MSGTAPRRDNGLRAQTYLRLDDVSTHLVDELLDRLRDGGIAAYSAPSLGRRGPYGETVPPVAPSDSIYVDASARAEARAISAAFLREISEDIAWADIVAGYERDDVDALARGADDDAVAKPPPWPVSEDVEETVADPTRAPAADTGGDDPMGGPTRAAGPRRGADEGDDHFEPPPPPPLPRMDRLSRFAWAGALGGPALLVLAALAGVRLQGWVGVLALVAFMAGFVTLVARMKDRPPTDSGPDDGAIV